MTMKKILYFIAATSLMACANKEKSAEPAFSEVELSTADQQIATGRELFETKGNCAACHQPEQRVIGPSITEIVGIYKKENADIVEFLKENGKPIVDPSQYEVMKTNFAITKKMSDIELEAIEAYMYSHLK